MLFVVARISRKAVRMSRPVVRSEAVSNGRVYRLSLEAQQRIDSARAARGQAASNVPREVRALTGPGAQVIGCVGCESAPSDAKVVV